MSYYLLHFRATQLISSYGTELNFQQNSNVHVLILMVYLYWMHQQVFALTPCLLWQRNLMRKCSSVIVAVKDHSHQDALGLVASVNVEKM